MFHLIIKKHARIPASNSWVARRTKGPGMASNYFYQVIFHFDLYLLYDFISADINVTSLATKLFDIRTAIILSELLHQILSRLPKVFFPLDHMHSDLSSGCSNFKICEILFFLKSYNFH